MVDITGALSNIDLTKILPSSGDLLNNLALGAATSVVLAGVKSQAGQAALDPLGLFHRNDPAPQVAQANNPSVVIGPTVTASAFAMLPPATQAQLTASGVHIIAG